MNSQKKNVLNFVNIIEKNGKKSKKIVIFLKFQKCEYLKNETLKQRNWIWDNFTTKYRKNAWDRALETSKSELLTEEFYGK